jgi:hypothetical protein
MYWKEDLLAMATMKACRIMACRHEACKPQALGRRCSQARPGCWAGLAALVGPAGCLRGAAASVPPPPSQLKARGCGGTPT